jgi:hypothetical protein
MRQADSTTGLQQRCSAAGMCTPPRVCSHLSWGASHVDLGHVSGVGAEGGAQEDHVLPLVLRELLRDDLRPHVASVRRYLGASRPQPVAGPQKATFVLLAGRGQHSSDLEAQQAASEILALVYVLQCFGKLLLHVSIVQQIYCSEAHQGVACEVGLLASRWRGPVAPAISNARGSQRVHPGLEGHSVCTMVTAYTTTAHAPTTHVMLSGSGLPVTAHE